MQSLRKAVEFIDKSTAERKLLYSTTGSGNITDFEGPHVLYEGHDPVVE
jgi:hypothetical protein